MKKITTLLSCENLLLLAGFCLILTIFGSCGFKDPNRQKIDYSTQVKPLINKHCITCHGGVKRQAEFSLLFRQDALDTTESGKPAILPGDEHSELIRRITSIDTEERMPYKEEPLSKEEIGILTDWIRQGAPWGDHWAYVAPKNIEVPKSNTLFSAFWLKDSWPKNNIDYFIQEKLNDVGLKPSNEADKATLIRRASLDLVGLPPNEEQVKRFLSDDSDGGYEKIIDELLASPEFGEKWASWWLDMARYSDTKGYERDVYRSIWRYRDWVIKAFNNDMPYDQFTIEQLAGDLLPNPTDDQLLATAFHRNTMNNDEGGTEDEEFRVASVIDRVNTTWAVWQSTTMACVQCHSHPYDPFRHEEYYKSMAYFNNQRDEDAEGEHPNLRMYKEVDQKKLDEILSWVKTNSNPQKEFEVKTFLKTLEPKIHPHDFDQFINGELIDTKWLGIRHGGSARLKNINMEGKTQLIINYWASDTGGSFEIRKDDVKGELLAQVKLDTTKSGRRAISIPLKPTSGKHDLYFVFHNPSIKPDQSVCGIEWFAFRDHLPGDKLLEHQQIESNFLNLVNAKTDNTPIMIENNDELHRSTFVFERGNWLVRGEEVKPDVPKLLNPFPKDQPGNRLGFAKWLVSKDNPLTARTAVNRVWEQIFGNGIVETMEDFGTQGALPSHPEMLDWLSLQFMSEYNWSVKKLIKEMVMSATYRQDSRVSDKLLEADPQNRFLARGSRVRLSAEQVHDQALAVSGLLSKKMYGRSVMPPQPDGVWQSVWSDAKWETSKGEDDHRRAIYTFQKRTSPYPSAMTFDGSSREFCVIKRIRTNTPLQALVTLNDPVYVDAATALARKMMKASTAPDVQIKSGYQSAVLHPISEKKLQILLSLYQNSMKEYRTNFIKTKTNGKQKVKVLPQLQAMTIVASAILNLDEFITKE